MSTHKKEFTHVNEKGMPRMVDVSKKDITRRIARAESILRLSPEIMKLLHEGDIHTKKGPVFQTAIVAGITGVKKTSDLIPMCHPLMLEKCDIDISIKDNDCISITCEVQIYGKTGVEMEALTGASIAALTIYDMCKGISQDMVIENTRLVYKSGGKSDINRL